MPHSPPQVGDIVTVVTIQPQDASARARGAHTRPGRAVFGKGCVGLGRVSRDGRVVERQQIWGWETGPSVVLVSPPKPPTPTNTPAAGDPGDLDELYADSTTELKNTADQVAATRSVVVDQQESSQSTTKTNVPFGMPHLQGTSARARGAHTRPARTGLGMGCVGLGRVSRDGRVVDRQQFWGWETGTSVVLESPTYHRLKPIAQPPTPLGS